jgi:hypothetical protein
MLVTYALLLLFQLRTHRDLLAEVPYIPASVAAPAHAALHSSTQSWGWADGERGDDACERLHLVGQPAAALTSRGEASDQEQTVWFIGLCIISYAFRFRFSKGRT